MTARTDPDQKMLQAALRGDAEAAAALTRAAADLVWSACLRVTRARAETEEAFRDVMTELRADRFARLKGYDGRARVRIYIDARGARSVVGAPGPAAGDGMPSAAGALSKRFSSRMMRRMIQRMLPGNDHQQDREDAYQSVCEALLKNDLQRLRAYSGEGAHRASSCMSSRT